MKQFFTICLFLCLAQLDVSAQVFDQEWQWANGISSLWNSTVGWDWYNKQNMTVDENGNIYTLSNVFFNDIKINPYNGAQLDTVGQSGRDLILTKYNCSGDLVWSKLIATKYKSSMGSILTSGYELLNGRNFTEGNIICDKQGNLFFSFYHSRSDTLLLLDSVYYHNDVVDVNWKLLKVDTNGVLLDVASFQRSDSINIMILDWAVSDEGEVYCGASTLSDSNTPSNYGGIIPGYRYSIGKLDKNTLDFQWVRRFSDLNMYGAGFIVTDIEIDHGNDILVGGYINDSLSIFGEDFYIDYDLFSLVEYKVAYMAKFDTFGNLKWFNKGSQAQPNPYDSISHVIPKSISVDENNNVFVAVTGARAYFNGVVANPDTGFTVTSNVFKLNENTGLAEWILYAEKARGTDRWIAERTEYIDGVLFCGGFHGTAKIDSTIFDATAGAFDPLLVAIDPMTGAMVDRMRIPTDGGSHSFIHELDSDEKGNLFISMMQNGELQLAGFDTINELHTGRPTGLILKYGEADCVCLPPSINLGIISIDSVNQEVVFDATAAQHDFLNWDFGDGTEWLDTSITSFSYIFPEDTTYQICVTAVNNECGTATSCINIDLEMLINDTTITDTTIVDTTIVDTTIAIREINAVNWGITIYPNPTQDHLFIELSGAILDGEKDLLVFDLTGQFIAQTQIKSNVKQTQIDLTNLSPGVYIIRVDNGKHHYVGKIIKQE